MATIISHSAAETESLGEEFGRVAKPGWVIGLTGDLGAGKTAFVRGLARGMAVTNRIHSPTFALVNEYAGSLPLYHLDLYRLETRAEIIGAGLEEYFFQKQGVTVVEWIERWMGKNRQLAENPCCIVQIAVINETERHITYEDFGI
ncbi:MAG: tRNA (adenosine(37)-N6)-threonylcarbamoyltransferase complex ATPase subunit type 1 TsaE [Verrucomicrobiota bacterium]